MKRISFVYAVFAFLLLLSGLAAVCVVSANPYFDYTEIEPLVGAIPPTISITSPQNNMDYPEGYNISFSVGEAKYENYLCDFFLVSYTIDGVTEHVSSHDLFAASQYNRTVEVPAGNHSLVVEASCILYHPKVFFIIGAQSEVCFTTPDDGAQVTISENTTAYTVRLTSTPAPTSVPTATVLSSVQNGTPTALAPASEATPTAPELQVTEALILLLVVSLPVVYYKRKNMVKQ